MLHGTSFLSIHYICLVHTSPILTCITIHLLHYSHNTGYARDTHATVTVPVAAVQHIFTLYTCITVPVRYPYYSHSTVALRPGQDTPPLR